MAVKILERGGKYGGSIVAVDGILKVVDPPKQQPCMGYENCCTCGSCSPTARKREAAKRRAKAAGKCGCDNPVPNEGSCFKCGKPTMYRFAA